MQMDTNKSKYYDKLVDVAICTSVNAPCRAMPYLPTTPQLGKVSNTF